MTQMSPRQSQHTGCLLSREYGVDRVLADNNIPSATIVSFLCFFSVRGVFIGSV